MATVAGPVWYFVLATVWIGCVEAKGFRVGEAILSPKNLGDLLKNIGCQALLQRGDKGRRAEKVAKVERQVEWRSGRCPYAGDGQPRGPSDPGMIQVLRPERTE